MMDRMHPVVALPSCPHRSGHLDRGRQVLERLRGTQNVHAGGWAGGRVNGWAGGRAGGWAGGRCWLVLWLGLRQGRGQHRSLLARPSLDGLKARRPAEAPPAFRPSAGACGGLWCRPVACPCGGLLWRRQQPIAGMRLGATTAFEVVVGDVA